MNYQHSNRKRLCCAVLGVSCFFMACAPVQSGSSVQIPASAFYDSVNNRDVQLVDVRTPGEYNKGHLSRAVNMDISADDFIKKAKGLNKAMPLYLYCLSGDRSGVASRKLAKLGYQVYDMKGGMIKWKAAKYPLDNVGGLTNALVTREAFNSMISAEKPVLIDFYGEWCGPCRQMKPFLQNMAITEKAWLNIATISFDDNKTLCDSLQVDELPYLMLFRNGQKLWENKGVISGEDLLKAVRDAVQASRL